MQNKPKSKKIILGLTVAIIIVVVVAASLAIIFLLPRTQSQTAVISVVPDSMEPTVGETFTINITISNATQLSRWDIVLEYDVRVVNCTNAWIPSDNVFKNLQYFALPYSYFDTNETGFGGVEIGVQLIGENEINVVGPEVLCSLNFSCLSTGETDLRIATKTNPSFQVAAFPIERHSFIQSLQDIEAEEQGAEAESPFIGQNGRVGQQT